MGKVVTLQFKLDKVEDFQDTVNRMLKDTYYKIWKCKGLTWMDDYPQVMAGIHACLLDGLKARGQIGEGPSLDMSLVNGHFSADKLVVIRRAYDLLAEEEAEEMEGEGDELVVLGEAALVGPHGMAKVKLLTCLITRSC